MNDTEGNIILKSFFLKDDLERLINLVQTNQAFFGNPPAGVSCVKVAIDKLEELAKEAIVSAQARPLKVLWWEASVGFNCLCEYQEIVISDESGDKTCDTCGRVYRFTTKLEMVKDAEIAMRGDVR